MTYTRETLLQLYLEGTLNGEAQKQFDDLFRNDPEFTRQAVESLEGKLGAAPEAWVEETAARLDPKAGNLWKAHAQGEAWALLKKIQWLFVAALLGGIGLSWAWIKVREAERLKGGAGLESSAQREPGTKASKSGIKRVLAENEIQTADPSGQMASESLSPAFRPPTEGEEPPSPSSGPAEAPLSPSGKPGSSQEVSSLQVSSSRAAGSKVQVVMDDLETSHVKIKVINSSGALIRVLYEGSWEPDQHIYWNGVDQDGRKASPGDYFIVVQTATKTISRKVSLR